MLPSDLPTPERVPWVSYVLVSILVPFIALLLWLGGPDDDETGGGNEWER